MLQKMSSSRNVMHKRVESMHWCGGKHALIYIASISSVHLSQQCIKSSSTTRHHFSQSKEGLILILVEHSNTNLIQKVLQIKTATGNNARCNLTLSLLQIQCFTAQKNKQKKMALSHYDSNQKSSRWHVVNYMNHQWIVVFLLHQKPD